MCILCDVGDLRVDRFFTFYEVVISAQTSKDGHSASSSRVSGKVREHNASKALMAWRSRLSCPRPARKASPNGSPFF